MNEQFGHFCNDVIADVDDDNADHDDNYNDADDNHHDSHDHDHDADNRKRFSLLASSHSQRSPRAGPRISIHKSSN